MVNQLCNKALKKFRVTEMRQTNKGEWFAVDTFVEAESKEELKNALKTNKPLWIKDKNYRIREVEGD